MRSKDATTSQSQGRTHMAQPENIIQDAIDRDVASGKLVPITDAAQHRIDAQTNSTYDIYFEIDCDCEELLDAIGLEYKQCEDDDTQNEVCISLDIFEASDVLNQSLLTMTNEQTIAAAVLNHELSEYTTKATIYTPSGDVITFY